MKQGLAAESLNGSSKQRQRTVNVPNGKTYKPEHMIGQETNQLANLPLRVSSLSNHRGPVKTITFRQTVQGTTQKKKNNNNIPMCFGSECIWHARQKLFFNFYRCLDRMHHYHSCPPLWYSQYILSMQKQTLCSLLKGKTYILACGRTGVFT